jgi:histidyl-tRNA synthetase
MQARERETPLTTHPLHQHPTDFPPTLACIFLPSLASMQGSNVGSIAAGGRYDTLVGMFSGKDVPAVGVSIGIERVFAIMEAQAQEVGAAPVRSTQTQVLVASIGNGMQAQRMELAATLWRAGIAAEFGFKANPKMGDQLGAAFDAGIPFMVLFGSTELEAGIVKVKDIAAKTEDEVPLAQLVDDLKRRLAQPLSVAVAAPPAPPAAPPA